MSQEQRIVHFSGDVQGVGFRFTACSVAGRHDVTGYVRNLPDGRVECVVEGQADEIERFLADLRRHMADYISSEKQETSAYTGRYRGFDVRF